MKLQRLQKKVLSLLISSMFIFTAVPVLAQDNSSTSSGVRVVTGGFSDVSRTHPNYVAITYMSDSGVINGYDDGTFKPANAINRAEVLKIILGGSNVAADAPFEAAFPDVKEADWFAKYVIKAKTIGIVSGNSGDGTFTPARQVNMAEFLKMLLITNNVNVDSYVPDNPIPNIPEDAWFANYVNYSAALGIVNKDVNGEIDAARPMTRGEVISSMYLLNIIRNGSDTQFLLSRAEAEMAQIEIYIAANQVILAKAASDLAVDITQQAYSNLPDNNVVVGAAKIARSYDWLVDAFIYGVQNNFEEANKWANMAIDKSTEAWEANNATQPIAAHIKDRAREILAQTGGTEE